MSDLIERLRRSDNGVAWTGKGGLMCQAADTLEAKTSDLMNKNRMIDVANDLLTELAAEIERLEKGMRAIQAVTSDKKVLDITDEALTG
jgi:hypothetical protein